MQNMKQGTEFFSARKTERQVKKSEQAGTAHRLCAFQRLFIPGTGVCRYDFKN